VGLVTNDAIMWWLEKYPCLHRGTPERKLEATRSAFVRDNGALGGSTLTPIVVFLPLISITEVLALFLAPWL